MLGIKPLASIEREDVERLVAGMLTGYGRKPDGYSAKTIQNVIRMLSRIFNFAKSRRPAWVDRNPVEGIELPKVDDGDEITFLDQPEIPLLLAAVDDESEFAALDRALYLTAAMTGLRQGELLALRWRDVDWKASKINVRLNRTRSHGDRSPKSKASRRPVPMPDAIGGELDRLFKASKFRADNARVFGHPSTGDPISYTALDERLIAAVKASGVRPVTCHGLRHTFGTQCARGGVKMRTLQQWMGHARISTTERYAQFARDQQETAMVEAAFSALTHSLTHSEQN